LKNILKLAIKKELKVLHFASCKIKDLWYEIIFRYGWSDC
jgi:hypothetical protein